MFDSDNVCKRVSLNNFQNGIQNAIGEAETNLKRAYEIAIQKHRNSDDYEEALWAAADGDMLPRQISEIYDKSYTRIMIHRRDRTRLSKELFYQRMNSLKKRQHGEILIGNRQGWYHFQENMVRGYVRLRAQKAGIKLGIDHPHA